jgi:hypothetical protein
VIVLNQDAITEVKAMVLSAPHAHRILLQQPQTRGGFAGIGDTDNEAMCFGYILGCLGSNATESL